VSYKKREIYLTDEELKAIILEETLFSHESDEEAPLLYKKAMRKLEREAVLRGLWDKEGEE